LSQPLDNPAPRTAPLPAVLQSVKHDTRRLLATRLQKLFQNADDALFELADRAKTDFEQNLYFDSMRIVRLQRASIQQKYIDAYSRSWNAVMSGQPAIIPSAPRPLSTQDDSQLAKDELEVSATAAAISSKATVKYLQPISQLTKRLEDVCGHEVAPELNPLGPQCLNQNFISAIAPLDVNIKVRIILLELFERFVAAELAEVYDQANRVLVEAEGRSELQHGFKSNPKQDASAAITNTSRYRAESAIPEANSKTATQVPADAAEGVSEGFAHLQGLLAKARDAGHLNPETARDALSRQEIPYDDKSDKTEGYAGAKLGVASLVSTPELMQTLGHIQGNASEVPLNLEQPEPPIDLRSLLVQNTAESVPKDGPIERSGESSGEGPGFENQTDDVVDLVKLLFDFILNDRNLAIPMKALIARLQIPLLKVAIIDQSLFAKPSHPARQLLNELAEAGIGWSSAGELKRDETYNKIESIVFRVMNGFSEDLTLFSNLIAELRHFVKKEKRKRYQVEQQVRQTEAGKAKTREAKKTVQTLINQKSCGLHLPVEAGRFVSDVWSKVLVYLFVTQGTDSEPWVEAIETLDDLLWATQPLASDRDINRREELLPRLLTQLEAGITLANLADAQSNLIRMRDTIERLHEADQQLIDEQQVDAEVTRSAITTTKQQAIVLVPEEDAPPGELETLADTQFIEKIIKLSEGQWLELRENNGTLLRCKLATIVQPGNRYVFVNRKGMKVCERSRNALALALQADELHLIDESEMFDRALESVIGNLQRLKDSRPQ